MALRVLACNVEHPVGDRELDGETGEPVGDVLGQGPQHRRSEEHHLEDAGPECPVASCHALAERDRVDGQLPQVDIVAGHCLEHGLHEDALQRGQAADGRDGGGHAPGEELGLHGIRRRQ
jgi:hypothetical protein